MERLSADFLGKQGVYDAMLLPETFTSKTFKKGVYYNPYFTIKRRSMKCEMKKLVKIIFLLINFNFLLSCMPVGWISPSPYNYPPINENTLIEMNDFSIKSPAGSGWGVKIERNLSHIMFIRVNIQLDLIWGHKSFSNTCIFVNKNQVPEEKWHLSEQEFTNDCVKEVDTVFESKNVNKGQTTIDGKKLFFISYKGDEFSYRRATFVGENIKPKHWELGLDIGESIRYIYYPKNFREKHIFYTFLIDEPHTKKIPKSYKIDLEQILPVIRSFQVKYVTEE